MAIPCAHCGKSHADGTTLCPETGGRLERGKAQKLGATRQQPVAPVPRPSPRWPAPRAPDPSSPSISSFPGARTDMIGRTIGGKYNVRAILGVGGMGTVFEALNLDIGRQVAVKVLHASQMRKKDAVRRFQQEARAAGAIGHPNICRVYDMGNLEDGCPYLVMEKLVGETLADRIEREGGLPIDEAVDILMQVLSGLVAAHEKGIVHRDIKPENVFLTQRVGCAPVAKLLDFGVSKVIAVAGDDTSQHNLTRTGIVLGTPYYLAPEQARGERNLDARVDLYACGVMLYEALTGKRPFTAPNYNALLLTILTATPKPASVLRLALPPTFDPVIAKAMARERDERYQTAEEFLHDLQRLGPRLARGERAPVSEPFSRPEVSSPRLGTTRRNSLKRASSGSIDVPVDFTAPPAQPPRQAPPSRPPPPLASTRTPSRPAPPPPSVRPPPPSVRPPPPPSVRPPPPASSHRPPQAPRPPPPVPPASAGVPPGYEDMPTEVMGSDSIEAKERAAAAQGFTDDADTEIMSHDAKEALLKVLQRPPRK